MQQIIYAFVLLASGMLIGGAVVNAIWKHEFRKEVLVGVQATNQSRDETISNLRANNEKLVAEVEKWRLRAAIALRAATADDSIH